MKIGGADVCEIMKLRMARKHTGWLRIKLLSTEIRWSKQSKRNRPWSKMMSSKRQACCYPSLPFLPVILSSVFPPASTTGLVTSCPFWKLSWFYSGLGVPFSSACQCVHHAQYLPSGDTPYLVNLGILSSLHIGSCWPSAISCTYKSPFQNLFGVQMFYVQLRKSHFASFLGCKMGRGGSSETA